MHYVGRLLEREFYMAYRANAEQHQTERPPVFVSIQTSSFSGATLLAFFLCAHPQIATVVDMNGLIAREDPERYLCSCGKPIKACAFWQSVGAAMRERGFEFDVARFGTEFALGGPRPIQYLRRGSFRNNTIDSIRDAMFRAWPAERRRLRALVDRNVAFVDAVLKVTGKRVFVDTSKDRLRLNALYRRSPFDVRAIHLIRDVRGVVASRMRRNSERGTGGAHVDAREAARQWARLHQRLQITLTALPESRRMRVRYEDLCQDAPGTLERIYHFCEVDPTAGSTDLLTSTQHIVGNSMRLANLSEIRLDERWRNVLTRDQLEQIRSAAGRLSYQYGYQG